MKPNPILTNCFRGSVLESVHRGRWVVVESDRVLDAGGDTSAWIYPRSSLKPLQLLPLFASGVPERIGLDAAEQACCCASHSGDEEHVAAVRRIQAKGGVPESALGCGPHEPIDREAAVRLAARGDTPLPIHNNCSGKHSGFLIRARSLDAPLDGYLDPEHPVQREIRALLAELTGIAEADLVPGIDGCGAPNWPLPPAALAGMFRDLANPRRLPARLRDGADRIFDAVNAQPHFLAGRGRFDTALLSARPGVFLGKCGAEGCFALGVRATSTHPPLGIVVKVDDGAKRGYEAALPDLLVELGLLDRTEASLAAFYAGDVRNTQDLSVGHMRSRFRPASEQ